MACACEDDVVENLRYELVPGDHPWLDKYESRVVHLKDHGIRMHYWVAGPENGKPVLLVHGLLANRIFWLPILQTEILTRKYRCYAPDLPMGAQCPDSIEEGRWHKNDFTVEKFADVLASFTDAVLGPKTQTAVVAIDTGGLVSQYFAAKYPSKIRALALGSCDMYNSFLPWPYMPTVYSIQATGPSIFGPVLRSLLTYGAWVYRTPLLLGWLTKKGFGVDYEDAIFANVRRSSKVAYEAACAMYCVERRLGREGTEKFFQQSKFVSPTLLAWSADDRLFPATDAKQFAADWAKHKAPLSPQAKLTVDPVPDSWSFSNFDNPSGFAEKVVNFLGKIGY
eukprot:Clim_evm18s198 gene=Clim_evmTU18s198